MASEIEAKDDAKLEAKSEARPETKAELPFVSLLDSLAAAESPAASAAPAPASSRVAPSTMRSITSAAEGMSWIKSTASPAMTAAVSKSLAARASA